MKIEKLVLKDKQEIELNKFTVLVGPNNVGKSQTLKDINDIFTRGKMAKTTLISEIMIEKLPDIIEYLNGLDIKDSVHNIGHKTVKGVKGNLIEGESFEIHMPSVENNYKNDGPSSLFSNIARFKISYLDAGTRLKVAQKTGSFNPHTGFPQNLLQAVYGDPHTEKTLQEAFLESFGDEIRLDYSGLVEFAFRVSKHFGEIPSDPRDAFEKMSAFSLLDDQGDGYKSFVGVVLSLLLSKDRIVLLDEPEAFLHPAQARQLGYWIAEHSKHVPGQIIVATHNSNFLSGILSSDQSVDIYRLNRSRDNTSFKKMGASETVSLVKSPLLSSQRVLDAIFHRGVVVCEADADRSIYQTVALKYWGTQEFLFIHAHNKQTISTVTTLLRNVDIPVCAIADIDVVNDDCFLDILKSIGGPVDLTKAKTDQESIIHAVDTLEESQALVLLKEKIDEFSGQLDRSEHTLSGARGALNRLRREASNWSSVKSEGISGLPKEVQQVMHELIETVKHNRLYIVPVGELEKWIELGVSQKNKWIIPALNHLFENDCPTELKNFVGDVIKKLQS
ncbi:ATP-dependent nuclease [Aeromonas veronii]|uniref:ATP-dependent nuclease n=1 Tax=Aeromonas veronii TaxID=654 RepID=UPI0005AB4BF0|nr:ATP-binding protein [Aeromonas veronii]